VQQIEHHYPPPGVVAGGNPRLYLALKHSEEGPRRPPGPASSATRNRAAS